MFKIFGTFLADENGVTSVEYGLIASLIAIAALVAIKSVGGHLKLTFGDVANNLSSM
ncbi:MAG TPA: Flp family type IVb pilin [Methylocystis sp.]|nr:Flp family type IVb pilin [Methylocystis sp.]